MSYIVVFEDHPCVDDKHTFVEEFDSLGEAREYIAEKTRNRSTDDCTYYLIEGSLLEMK